MAHASRSPAPPESTIADISSGPCAAVNARRPPVIPYPWTTAKIVPRSAPFPMSTYSVSTPAVRPPAKATTATRTLFTMMSGPTIGRY